MDGASNAHNTAYASDGFMALSARVVRVRKTGSEGGGAKARYGLEDTET